MQCGGAKKTPKALPKKMAKGGSTANKLNNARGFAPAQKGGDNAKKMIYGIPNAGMTGPNRNSQTETMQMGGAKKPMVKPKKRIVDSQIPMKGPDRPMPKPAMAKKGGSTFGMLSVKAGVDNNPNPTAADRIAGAKMKKAKFGASVKVQRSPKAGKIRSASAQGYSSIGMREPARIIKKTIGKKK